MSEQELRQCPKCKKNEIELGVGMMFDRHIRCCQYTVKKFDCPLCGKSVNIENEDKHKSDECPNRLIECEYCELPVKAKDHSNHTISCGARTDECARCKKRVQNKDKRSHDETCSETSGAGRPPEQVQSETQECPVCMTGFNASTCFPYMLTSCGHSICYGCIQELRNTPASFKCPECRASLSSATKNFALIPAGDAGNAGTNLPTSINLGTNSGQDQQASGESQHSDVLDLTSRNITTVNQALFQPHASAFSRSTIRLDLNAIKTIDTGGFHLFPNLTVLSLSGNQIADVSWLRFANCLANLKKLVLRANQIQTIEIGQLNKLVSLEELDLSNNRVKSCFGSYLKPLSRLKVLNLSSNQIQVIHTSYFSGLFSLEELDLYGNNVCFNELIKSFRVMHLQRGQIFDCDLRNLRHLYFNNRGSRSTQKIDEIERFREIVNHYSPSTMFGHSTWLF